MLLDKITSTSNEKIKKLVHLSKGNDISEDNLSLIESSKIIEIAHSLGLIHYLYLTKDNDLKDEIIKKYGVYEIGDNVSKKLSNLKTPPGSFALINKPTVQELTWNKSKYLFLDGIQNPGNYGMLLRNAVSFNYDGVLIFGNSCSHYSSKVYRSSMGANLIIPSYKVSLNDIKIAQHHGFTVVTTAISKPSDCEETPSKLILALGNESKGLSDPIINLGDMNYKIKINDFNSLNVVAAASIIMYNFFDLKND